MTSVTLSGGYVAPNIGVGKEFFSRALRKCDSESSIQKRFDSEKFDPENSWEKSMAMKVRVLLSSVLLLATVWLVSCGHYTCGATFGSSSCSASGGGISQGGGGTSSGDAFVYVADAGGVQGLTLDGSTGTFTDIPNPITGIPNATNYWNVIAQGQYMYIGYPGLGEIYGYTIASTGALTAISGSPFSAAYMIGSTVGGPQAMILNPAGTMLFVLNQSANAVYVYTIGTGGLLTEAATSPLTLPFLPLNLAVDGLGKYLYVTSASTDTSVLPQIGAYIIGSAGTLTAVPGSPFISNGIDLNYALAQMQGDPSGAYMIGTTSSITNSDSHLYVLAITQSGANAGAITPVTGSPFVTSYSPVAVAVQPSAGGTLVYSMSFKSLGIGNFVEGYTINLTTGALTAIAGSPFTVLGGAAQFDQSGQLLFVVEDPNSTTTEMDVYNVSVGSALVTPTATVGWGQGSWAP